MAFRREEFYENGREALSRIREIVRKGNASRVIVKDEYGKTILSIPVTLGVAGALFAPFLAGVSFVLALVKKCSIVVESHDE